MKNVYFVAAVLVILLIGWSPMGADSAMVDCYSSCGHPDKCTDMCTAENVGANCFYKQANRNLCGQCKKKEDYERITWQCCSPYSGCIEN